MCNSHAKPAEALMLPDNTLQEVFFFGGGAKPLQCNTFQHHTVHSPILSPSCSQNGYGGVEDTAPSVYP